MRLRLDLQLRMPLQQLAYEGLLSCLEAREPAHNEIVPSALHSALPRFFWNRMHRLHGRVNPATQDSLTELLSLVWRTKESVSGT